MKTSILLLVLALAGGSAAAQESGPDLRELRARLDRGAAALRGGDDATARTAFEAVAAGLGPAFAAGEIKPKSGDEAWVLYASAVLLQSDLWRYRLGDPRRARDLEAGFGREAERLGYADLAAAQGLSVADIERFDLADPKAALVSYRHVLGLSSIDGGLHNQAAQGVAQTPGGPRDVLAEIRLEVPLTMAHIEATSLVIPHLNAYQKGDPASAYAAFAAAHPRSFRAVYAGYAGFLVPVVFRGENAPDPATLATSFVAQYPDDVLSLTVLQQLAEHQERQGMGKAAEETRQRRALLEKKLGLPLPTPSAATRHSQSGFERRARPAASKGRDLDLFQDGLGWRQGTC